MESVRKGPGRTCAMEKGLCRSSWAIVRSLAFTFYTRRNGVFLVELDNLPSFSFYYFILFIVVQLQLSQVPPHCLLPEKIIWNVKRTGNAF